MKNNKNEINVRQILVGVPGIDLTALSKVGQIAVQERWPRAVRRPSASRDESFPDIWSVLTLTNATPCSVNQPLT